ncbi:hypothetical protein EVAR_78939_1 [Eumeta japonica]|uniref:Uncharacterized protein n=1 Tax=Eumeta variegata TaxID=151549 RepID=A0A4C1U2T2_EUMVA|nr:hypothetical protein EVAR_78939_1 [Eumeta japonica]
MRSLCSMCGVSGKDRCRDSDVRERCGWKEDLVTGVDRVATVFARTWTARGQALDLKYKGRRKLCLKRKSLGSCRRCISDSRARGPMFGCREGRFLTTAKKGDGADGLATICEAAISIGPTWANAYIDCLISLELTSKFFHSDRTTGRREVLPLVFNSETLSDAEPQPGPSKRLRTE